MADEKLTFDLIANDKASAGFAAAGRSAAAASDDVLGLAKRLDEISRKSAKAKVGLEGDRDADLSLDRLNLKLLKLGKTVTRADVGVDGVLKATIEVKALELELDKLNRKAAEASVSGGGLSLLEKTLGSIGGVGGGSIGGGIGGAPLMIAGVGAAVVALLPELAGLVSGFAAAGAGAGAFGLLALPTFKNIATAYTGISAAHQKYMNALAAEKQDPTKANATATAKALDALRVAQTNLSPSTKTAVGGIQALDDEYHKMATAFAPDALKIFDDGLRIANTLLPLVTPFADTAATALDGLLKRFENFITPVSDSVVPLKNMSDTTARLLEGAQKPPTGFQQFVTSLHSIEGPALTAIGNNFGKLGVQVGKLFTIMSAKDVVNAINIGFGIIDGVLVATGYTVKRLMVVYDDLSGDVEAATANAKLHTQQLVTFFTSTVPTGLEIFRNNARLVWDQVELDVLHMASSVTGTMGKLPGPLGAPFRSAHTAIAHDLAGIEANVATTELQINRDWAKIHNTASIAVRADGTFKVGTTGPVARAAGGLITGGTPGRDSVLAALMPGEVVVPTRMVSAGAVDHLRGRLPGFASGGVVGSYSGAVPGLGPWMGKEASATQAMLEQLTAKATAAAIKAAQAGPASGGGRTGWNPGAGVNQWRATALSALSQLGLSPGLILDVLYQMMTESGGNPNAVNRTDSNWLAGHPSVGLMQVIHGTFDEWAGKYLGTGPFSYGVSTNPMANIYAALNYGKHGRGFGTGPGQIGSGHGYAAGTGGAAPGWARVGELGTELVHFSGGETVLPASMTSRILSGTVSMPGYAAGTAKPSAQQAKYLAELAADVASRNKLATARSKSDHARQLAVTAEELLVLQHPGNKPDAAKLASMRKALGSWEASTIKPIALLNREITLLRTLTGNPNAVKYGGPGPAPAAAGTSGTDPGAAGTGTAAPPTGPAPGTPVLAVTGGPVAPILPGAPFSAVAVPPRGPSWYGGGGPYAGGAPQGGYGSRSGFEQGIPAALIAELRAMHASMVVMHKGIVAAVGKVGPVVAQGVNQGLNGKARSVVTR